MTRNYLMIAGFIISFCLFAGCVPDSYRMAGTLEDPRWGEAFKTARENQILNPDAGRNLEPMAGLNGKAAGTAVDKYNKSFEKQAPETKHVITIGNIGRK